MEPDPEGEKIKQAREWLSAASILGMNRAIATFNDAVSNQETRVDLIKMPLAPSGETILTFPGVPELVKSIDYGLTGLQRGPPTEDHIQRREVWEEAVNSAIRAILTGAWDAVASGTKAKAFQAPLDLVLVVSLWRIKEINGLPRTCGAHSAYQECETLILQRLKLSIKRGSLLAIGRDRWRFWQAPWKNTKLSPAINTLGVTVLTFMQEVITLGGGAMRDGLRPLVGKMAAYCASTTTEMYAQLLASRARIRQWLADVAAVASLLAFLLPYCDAASRELAEEYIHRMAVQCFARCAPAQLVQRFVEGPAAKEGETKEEQGPSHSHTTLCDAFASSDWFEPLWAKDSQTAFRKARNTLERLRSGILLEGDAWEGRLPFLEWEKLVPLLLRNPATLKLIETQVAFRPDFWDWQVPPLDDEQHEKAKALFKVVWAVC